MSTERSGLMKIGGVDVTIVGDDLEVGDTAPDFLAQANDWSLTRGLGDTPGKVRILAALPSLETSVCDEETRRFNTEAAGLSPDIVVEAISTDLPYSKESVVSSRARRSVCSDPTEQGRPP